MFKKSFCIFSASACSMAGYVNFKKYDKDKLNIVFDIDNTLIDAIDIDDYNDCKFFKKPSYFLEFNDVIEYAVFERPCMYLSILFLSTFNNLHVMTRSKQEYADKILKKSNIYEMINIKKYREDCKNEKDLNLISSNVKNCILIDDRITNKKEEQNFYHIQYYTGFKNFDIEMIKLCFYVVGLNIKKDLNL